MKSRELQPLLKRVRTWPQGAQREAIKALREIEEDFVIGPATQIEIDAAHRQALRGEGISFEDLKERFSI